MFSWTEIFPLISNIVLALLAKSVFCSIFLEWQSIQKINASFLRLLLALAQNTFILSEIYPPKYFVHQPQQPDTIYYFFESLFFFSFPAFSYPVFKKRLLWSHIEYCSLFIFLFLEIVKYCDSVMGLQLWSRLALSDFIFLPFLSNSWSPILNTMSVHSENPWLNFFFI